MTQAMNDAPTSERVAEAVLHFARLAAAHAQYGVAWMTAEQDALTSREPDAEPLAVLAEVTALLHKDRERVGKEVSDALVARAHKIAEEEFWRLRREPFDAVSEEGVEDRIEVRFRDELRVGLSAEQKKSFAVDEQYVRKRKGASNASAEILGRVFGLRTGRSVYVSRESAGEAPPVPAPLDRWVSLHKVGQYVSRVLHWAAAVRKAAPVLPLEALRGTEHLEALVDRVEGLFRERTKAELDAAQVADLAPLYLALLRGEHPSPHLRLEPKMAQEFERVRGPRSSKPQMTSANARRRQAARRTSPCRVSPKGWRRE